ncbi:MAG: hypothetical protein CM1200mP2_00160 [Planctomycetaceae bacterium]|nr:MAG: hypothetical protein CM1200mP2_00160 [Planctomycetaceae bacterium]
MLSATYRMQSSPRKDAMAVDPENRLWWRSPLRRLEAEALRDAMLAVAGQLDPQMGGSLLHVKNRGYFFDHTSKDETRTTCPVARSTCRSSAIISTTSSPCSITPTPA